MAHSIPSLTLLAALVAAAPLTPATAAEPPSERWVDELTLEEKASLVTGQNAWETFEVERLDIPAAWMADGPVGLRRSTGENVDESVPATCFPSAAGMAATWNESLIEEVGAAIGSEARAQRVSLLLAPGLNIKRHPLGGRNFEYYSEDPLLSGRTAAAFVRGVQSRGVGATLKHFAVNNQEWRRMSIDARVAERPLREIYLRGFEIAIRESRPQAVMSAYNLVNGLSASENPRLLTEILRDEWDYEGLVVSDWGAVNDPVVAVEAGLDLEMPGNPLTPPVLVRAVEEGRLDEAHLDRAVGNVLQLVERHLAMDSEPALPDFETHHELARQVAVESMVLLKNDGFLPLEDSSDPALGVVGSLAVEPRIQGIGSSQVQATQIDVPWPFVERYATEGGYSVEHWGPQEGGEHLTESDAANLADFLLSRDRIVVFAGQERSQDAEAWDRASISLSAIDLEILEAVKTSGRPFAVVLIGGASIDVRPFEAEAGAVLMSWLGGQAFGSAVADVLFGRSAPSGKLPETFALSVDDHPSSLNFPGNPRSVLYGEGLYVGYRYFQTFDRAVSYPFGHGLSYTTFEYGDAEAPVAVESGDFDVSVEVTNTGSRRGAEVVQFYLRHLEPSRPRPGRELVGFRKVELDPGESARASVTLDPSDFAYFDEILDSWVTEPGDYELLVGSSATDIRAVLPLRLDTGDLPSRMLTASDVIADVAADPQGQVVVDFLLERAGRGPLSLAEEDDFFAAILANLPFKKLRNFSEGAITDESIAGLMMLINSDMPPEQVRVILEQSAASRDE